MVTNVTEESPRPARTWRLRNPRRDPGPPLTAGERRIWPGADVTALAAAVISQALEDLDEGYTPKRNGQRRDNATARRNRAAAYLWFFHGRPTGFERYMAALGVQTRGQLPPCALFDDAAALARRRRELGALRLPVDLFDRRIVAALRETMTMTATPPPARAAVLETIESYHIGRGTLLAAIAELRETAARRYPPNPGQALNEAPAMHALARLVAELAGALAEDAQL